MGYTERDRAALEEGLRRLSDFNDELLMRGLDRLGQMGSTLHPGPPDRFWPTTLALITWHQQQRRAIGAALGALGRMTRRLGTDGVSRYPASEWGEPLALLGWMRRTHGPALAVGAASPHGETCPGCHLRPLIVGTRARGFGPTHEQRTFGHCHECKLALDLTGSHNPESTAPPAPGERSPTPPAPSAPPAPTTTRGAGRPYFDQQVNGWYRDLPGRAPLLLAGEHDTTDPHPSRHNDGDCWACGVAPHSRAYHDLQIAESLSRHGIKRVEENGHVRIESTDPSERFHDESAQ